MKTQIIKQRSLLAISAAKTMSKTKSVTSSDKILSGSETNCKTAVSFVVCYLNMKALSQKSHAVFSSAPADEK